MLHKRSAYHGIVLVLSDSTTLAMAASEDPALPLCRAIGEFRTPVLTWVAWVTPEGKLSAAPPHGNGRMVYIDLSVGDNHEACASPPGDGFSFQFTDETSGPQSGGLRLNFPNNRTNYYWKYGCVFNGFYVNEPVPGVRDGWRETSFRPVDRFEVMASGVTVRATQNRLPARPI